MKKNLYKILFALIGIIALERFCYKQTAGFREEKIAADLLPAEERSAGKEVQSAMEQPFTFLGSGVQCYAFVSSDQKWVLKVFKHYHMWPTTSLIKKLPPLPYFRKVIETRTKRMSDIYQSLEIAYELHQRGTGLVYLHLNQTSQWQKKLTLIDKIGIAHSIDLDTTPFALQKKADLVYPHLTHLINSGDMEGAQRAIDSLLELIIERCRLGIANSDPIFRRNFGFIEGKAVEIDIGSFTRNPFLKKEREWKKELLYETLELKEWLTKNIPLLATYLDEKISSHFSYTD